MKAIAPNLRRWVRLHQRAPGARPLLNGIELAYQAVRRVADRNGRPAEAGGWPIRALPFPAPQPFGGRELRELRRALRDQGLCAPEDDAVRRFERRMASIFGSRHAIAVSSGTSALHAALIAAEIGPGDEVIVPALTHASAALAVLYQGAIPRFADASPGTFNPDPARIEAAVTERTRAIVTVHLCGVPSELAPIRRLAERHGLMLIEDAAQAHGAAYEGRMVGTIGHLGCFSFQSAKTLVTGEGGAVLTDDDALARRVRLAIDFGEVRRTEEPGSRAEYVLVGWNYRMSNLQASVGLAQLERFEAARAARARNAARLREELEGLPGVELQAVPEGATACHSIFFARFDPAAAGRDRDAVAAGLRREGIDLKLPYDRPLAFHRLFGEGGSYPVAERICAEALGFRVDPSLRGREMAAVGAALRRLLAWRR